MKKRITIAVLFLALVGSPALAQEKPPTQAEVQQMMKELKKMTNELDPETKRMMDSMGIKIDMDASAKKLSGISDAQLKEAWENENRIVPKKKTAKIAAMPASVSNTGIAAYLTSNQAKLFAKLKPATKTTGDKLVAYFTGSGKTPAQIGNAAAALWMTGRLQLAFYVMHKALHAQPGDANNLSNYASMLQMLGAAEVAVPLLNNLNARYPRNSTILNNLGQAWFSLGDLAKSDKYLDSTIRIMGGHPQATFTKGIIKESQGKTTEAIAFYKQSIKTAYSRDKEQRLNKLGYKLTNKDFKLPPKTKADPMNLGGFKPPRFPLTVAECIALDPQWKTFKQLIDEEMAKLAVKQKEAANRSKAKHEALFAQTKAAMATTIRTGAYVAPPDFVPVYAERARKMQRTADEEYNAKLGKLMKKLADFQQTRGEQLRKNYDKQIDKLREEDLEQTGEGKPNENICPKYRDVADAFLGAYNSQLQDYYDEYLSIEKAHLNETAYYSMYALMPDEYEAIKVGLQASWLFVMKEAANYKSITAYKCVPPKEKGGKAELANFNDLHCEQKSTFWTPVGTMKMECDKWHTELDLQVVKIGLNQDMSKDGFAEQFVNCTVEVGIKAGPKVEAGPLEIGVEAGAGIGVEIGREGISDVFVTAGVEAGAGIGDPVSTSAGAEGKISLISGTGEINGSGLFE